MHGQQRLIGRHHMFARGYGLHHQITRHAIAPNQLYNDVDVGVVYQGLRIRDHLHLRPCQLLGASGIEVGNHGDFNAATRTALDFFLIALKHLKGTRAHGAHAHEAHLYRFHHFLLPRFLR